MALASNKTLGDLVPEVIDALQGRTDVASIAPRYLKRALEEITTNYPFEELRRTGPEVTLTVGQAIYPLNTFLDGDDALTSLEVPVIYVDPPTNSIGYDLKYKTPKAIEIMLSSATLGMPSYWTRFGQNLHLGPTPNQAYTMFLRYQMRHPFPNDDASLTYAQLFLPIDWEDIVVYAAAERIALVKRWTDQRKELHDMLYGDPDFQMTEGKRGRPGLIAARQFQVERDQRFDSRKLGITNARYGSR